MFGTRRLFANRSLGPMVFLGVVLAVMFGALVLSSSFVKPPKDVDRVEFGRVPTISFDTAVFDPKVADWGAVDDRTEAGLRATPVPALVKALDVVWGMSWGRMKDCANKVRENQYGFATLDADALLADPGAWRGTPVQVVGKLIEADDIDLFNLYDLKLPDGRFQVKQGTLRLRKGTHGRDLVVRFTLVDDQPGELPLLVPETELKIQGVFFKLQTLEVEGKAEVGAWLIAKRVFKSFELPAEKDIDLGMLDYVRDAELAADTSRLVFDEPPFFHLLARVYHGYKDAEVVPMKGKETRDLLANPRNYRGKVIKVQGRVIQIEHYSLASWFPELSAEDGPISEFWITYVTSDGYVPLAVMWLEEPKLDLKTNNQVNLEAAFYRVWGYLRDGKPKKAPLLIGRYRIEPLDVGAGHGLDPVSVGIAIFVVVTLTLVFFVLRHDRRRRALFEDTRRARRKLGRGPLASSPAQEGEGGSGADSFRDGPA